MYNVDYFIDFFTKIPEENIVGLHLRGEKKCVNGWLGVEHIHEPNEASAALQKVFEGLSITSNGRSWSYSKGEKVEDELTDFPGYSFKAAHINNGYANEYPQPTPKQRILAALQDIKKQQESLVAA